MTLLLLALVPLAWGEETASLLQRKGHRSVDPAGLSCDDYDHDYGHKTCAVDCNGREIREGRYLKFCFGQFSKKTSDSKCDGPELTIEKSCKKACETCKYDEWDSAECAEVSTTCLATPTYKARLVGAEKMEMSLEAFRQVVDQITCNATGNLRKWDTKMGYENVTPNRFKKIRKWELTKCSTRLKKLIEKGEWETFGMNEKNVQFFDMLAEHWVDLPEVCLGCRELDPARMTLSLGSVAAVRGSGRQWHCEMGRYWRPSSGELVARAPPCPLSL